MGGGEGGKGWGGGEGGGYSSQVKTRGPELPTDGPDHTTGRRDIIPVKGRIPGR